MPEKPKKPKKHKERKPRVPPLEERNREILFRAGRKIGLWMKENDVHIPQDPELKEKFLAEMRRADIILQRLDEWNLAPPGGEPIIPLEEIRDSERELGETLNHLKMLWNMDKKRREKRGEK
ncbi:MAG: hypothetical protein DRO04_02775 [Candidatus Iainarchaeum archaeon]|uniref:Uncharacterized protein n=1 Tax=Candidatus Iainarchaeum sp. TaxID=3101447 RepID=A0A497JFV3_9ARCH|nr:MAG: hypothetical protein DRO04_02775 [Candidatus Diapherotrites archaeon]